MLTWESFFYTTTTCDGDWKVINTRKSASCAQIIPLSGLQTSFFSVWIFFILSLRICCGSILFSILVLSNLYHRMYVCQLKLIFHRFMFAVITWGGFQKPNTQMLCYAHFRQHIYHTTLWFTCKQSQITPYVCMFIYVSIL